MKKTLTASLFLFIGIHLFSQCSINFGSSAAKIVPTLLGDGDIVQNTSGNLSSVQSFNIWDETTNNCSTAGGANDITIAFDIFQIADAYSGSTINPFAGVTHDIVQTTSGLRGSIPLGSAAANRTSTGDYRGYSIKVTFASHVDITAEELSVEYTSGNTVGTAYESSSLQFLDENGDPFGSATYSGYYTGAAIVAACPASSLPSGVTVRSNPWTLSGNGVFAAQSTATVQPAAGPDYCITANGSSNSLDDETVSALTTGIGSSTKIGGFIYTVYLEDVQAHTSDGTWTGTTTSFTSTLNGFNLSGSPLPVELLSFSAFKNKDNTVLLSWETATEKNNAYFIIERSTNGTTFEAIGKVVGATTSNELNKYSFTDASTVVGTNYYRLKQVDIDGKSTYSPTKVVEVLPLSEFVVRPTLASDKIEVILPESTTQSDLYFFDMLGNLTHKEILQNSSQFVNIQFLPSGTYILKMVTADKQSSSKRLVKL